MKIPKARCKLRISACVAVATLLTSAPLTVQAQSKLSAPGGWTIYNWATDYFNDTNLGWQWTDVAPSWWLYEKSDNRPERGGVTWSKFRQDNVIMDGNSLVVRNRYHYTPQSGGWSGRYNQNVNTYTYSGGWLESKASWLVEGQYQANSKVDWNFADIWPTFWLTYTGNGGHELDIMQYQLNALDHSHIVWKANSGGFRARHSDHGTHGRRRSGSMTGHWLAFGVGLTGLAEQPAILQRPSTLTANWNTPLRSPM